MNVGFFIAATALLGLERLCYIWISSAPTAFRAWVDGSAPLRFDDPVDAVRFLFLNFKVLQGGVFLAWCYVHGEGSLWPIATGTMVVVLGVSLMAAGQALSTSVFWRLGHTGVFYGNLFGHSAVWCRQFPFSWCAHPQYLGTVLSIWGFFLVMRFPHADWVALPILETVYYAIGARLER